MGHKTGRKAIDLAGQYFERLWVLKRHGTRNNGRHVVWECLCLCGKITYQYSQKLLRGKVKSCGCLKKEKAAAGISPRKKRPYEHLYNKLVKRAKERGYTVNYSYYSYLQLVHRNKWCHYCHKKLQFSIVSSSGDRRLKNQGYQVDRKDSSRGYEEGNCVACCFRCNYAKGNTCSHDEWHEMTRPWREGILPIVEESLEPSEPLNEATVRVGNSLIHSYVPEDKVRRDYEYEEI
jgi:hypothetical protein